MDRIAYYQLRNNAIVYAALGLFWALVTAFVVVICFEVVEECCGEESWPSAVFLSLVTLWCLRVGWRYLGQRNERDEDDQYEYYSEP